MSEMNASPDQERVRQLMMAEVDQEISGEERDELHSALEEDPGLRDELETFQRLKEVTDTMSPLKPPGETWDGYWEDVYRRLERGVSWILISLGAIVLGTWSVWTVVRGLIADTSIPGFIRWSIMALLAGFVILFVSVIRERLFMGKSDPYKDVVR
ncbi:MAG: hypothetical protein MJB57_01690 [Gemmatimonadetes bacterium]|nr:hypothetical protein [Gemmatimonadota bacterium]